MADSSPAKPTEMSGCKPSWPKLSLVVSVLLWLLAWEVIVWFVPVQPRVVIRTSDRLEGFSPDSQLLVTGLMQDGFLTGQIRLWDVKTGQKLEVVGEVGTNLLPNVVYVGQRDLISENRLCEKLVSSIEDRANFALYDLETRHKTGFFHLASNGFFHHFLCFAPDGQTFAKWTIGRFCPEDYGDLQLIDLPTGQVRVHLGGRAYRELIFSPDGSKLAMIEDVPNADGETLILILDTVTGETWKRLRIDGGALYPLCFSPDGQKLAIYCYTFNRSMEESKEKVIIWDLSSENMKSLEGERFAAFLPDGKGLATSGEDRKTIRFVDSVTGKEFAVTSNLSSYAWCPTFLFPVAGTHLLVIPTTHDAKPSLFLQLCGTLLGIKRLTMESHDQELAFLDTRTGKKAAAIVREGMGDPRISFDGKNLAISSFDEDEKFIELWDIPLRKPLRWVLGLLAIPSVVTLFAIWRWRKARRQSSI